MKKAILGALAVLPLAAAGVLASAGAANAANLGTISFSSEGQDPNTTLTFDSNLLSIDPDDGNAQVNVGGTPSGVFAQGFTQAEIKFADLLLGSTPAGSPVFLDFGTDDTTSADGLDVIKLTSIASDYDFLGGNAFLTNLGLTFDGIFESQGTEYIATGSLTFQVDQPQADVEAALASGETLGHPDGLTFSGINIATAEVAVPEPATILGLGVVAGSLALTRAGKKNKA
ncbi:MAG: PEP-CTERM sorting domain-containing protein [Coleofasciculus sp. C2-GNP5-27]